jgi:hypothetical protein
MVSSSGALRLRMCAQTTVMRVRRKEGRMVPSDRSARRVYFWRRANWGGVSILIVREINVEAYLRYDRHDQERAQQHHGHNRRCNEGLGAMCIEVLGPQGCPPWVGRFLLVVDIECMCRSSQNSNAEDDNQTVDSDLRHVKRSRVDLHLAGLFLVV